MSKEFVTKVAEENRTDHADYILKETTMGIIRNKDLVDSGQRIIRFAQDVQSEKDKESTVNYLYQHLLCEGMGRYAMEAREQKEQKKYCILEGERANCMYLTNTMPNQSSAVKTLRTLEAFGKQIVSQFSEPATRPLSSMIVDEIMNTLDETYNFSNIVFNDPKAVIAIINNTHIRHYSEFLIRETEFTSIPFIFLFSPVTDECTLEAILYHELGHVLQIQYSIATGKTPADMLAFINGVFGIKSNLQSDEIRTGVIADLLSVGLMQGGPFAAHIPFDRMSEDMREALNEYTRYALKQVKEKIAI